MKSQNKSAQTLHNHPNAIRDAKGSKEKFFFVVNDKLTLPDFIVLCIASSNCY